MEYEDKMDNDLIREWLLSKGIRADVVDYLIICINIYERLYKRYSPPGGPFKFKLDNETVRGFMDGEKQ